MKLIADLDVNGNQLRNGTKNIGPIVEEITPVNQNQITIDVLRDACLKDGNVPVDFTFEEFITALFVKVNPEVKDKATILPTVTVSGSLSGTTTEQKLEVGAAAATYTLTNTASKGTYTDGQALTHTITNGRVEDSNHYANIGCTENGEAWNGDRNTNTITNTISFTQFTAGQPASKESKTLTVGNITLTQSYTASTLDISKDSEKKPVFRSSYGNALYTSAGEAIPAGNCTATTTNGTSVKVHTHFYSWWKGKSYLGGISLVSGNQTLSDGDILICPSDKTPVITWTVFTPNDNSPASDMYTRETKYLKLPSGGDTASHLVSTVPTDAPYKEYHVYTFNSKLPSGINNAKITVAD